MRTIKQFLSNHQDFLLALLGLVFAAVIGVFLFWGLTVVGESINKALAPPDEGDANLRFDFDGYEKLNLGA
jgi:hypothetical protein